ncbi:hypothetical protein J3R30DRAFT_3402548 [Lentinula aciculospora]|uniref:Uncharacterized protein n=1 Tax=Lentinula aciculospora TaxID=153920 RepID=A0A9W9DSS4_9AGAR|nr:hypothetical protein J3R30DRAFT_3402548 [Lentinula aciculospora]
MRLLPSTSFHRLCPVFAVLLVIALLSVTIVASPLAAANGKLAHRETYSVYVALFDTTKQAYVENPTSPENLNKNQQLRVFMRNEHITLGFRFVESDRAIDTADPPKPFGGSVLYITNYILYTAEEFLILRSRAKLEDWVREICQEEHFKIENDMNFVSAHLRYVSLNTIKGNQGWLTFKKNLLTVRAHEPL